LWLITQCVKKKSNLLIREVTWCIIPMALCSVKEASLKSYMLCYSSYVTFSSEGEQMSGWQGLEVGRRYNYKGIAWEYLGSDETILILYRSTHIHQFNLMLN
jgi:hypothetical protein